MKLVEIVYAIWIYIELLQGDQ